MPGLRRGEVMRAAGLVFALLVEAGCVSAAPTGTSPAPAAGPTGSFGVLAATSTSPSGAMKINGAQAMPIPDNGNAVTVVAAVRNDTGRDDKPTGGSSPDAALVALYATCGCSPAPRDPATGIAGKTRMPWWLIRANETIQLRVGDGELIVSGLPQLVVAGQTIEVTFEFTYAAAVTVEVPVVASIA